MSTSIETITAVAERFGRTDAGIDAVENAAIALGLAQNHEAALEDDRAIVKAEAIRRMIGTENPATGKPHSASSAEAVVEQDEQYATHRRAQRDAVLATQRAWGAYEAAKLRALNAVNFANACALLEAR